MADQLLTKYIEFDDVTTAYVMVGQGDPPLVFIHGWSLCMDDWVAQIAHFSKTRRVMAYDLRGQGQSTGGEAKYEFRELVEDLRLLLAALNLHRPILCGHSQGASVALSFAIKYPDAVTGLILANIPGRQSRIVTRRVYKNLRATVIINRPLYNNKPLRPVLSIVRKLFYSRGFRRSHGPEMKAWKRQFLQNSWKRVLRAFKAAINGRKLTEERLGQVKAKTLVLASSKDKVVRRAEARWYHEYIPDAKLVIFEGAGHMSMREKPAEFTHLVEAFLTSL